MEIGMKSLLYLLILLIVAGCGYSGPPKPFEVGTSHIGSVSAMQKDPLFLRLGLSVDVSACAQIKELVIEVNMPQNLEIESYSLTTGEGQKYSYSKEIKPDSPQYMAWSGEIHPKQSPYQRIFKTFPKYSKAIGMTIKTPRSNATFKDKIKVRVRFVYYDDPTASPDFSSYGSYDKVFEFGSENWSN